MDIMIESVAIVWKYIGETPLQALERYRATQSIQKETPMTYAGRLDPMAEGELLILIGDECKNKERYLGLDKEYEVEVLFGISTDTHDVLGIMSGMNNPSSLEFDPKSGLAKYVGRFEQEYPAYSSRTVKGKQLHELARSGVLPEEMPKREVEIYSIELLQTNTISGADVADRAITNIQKVKGDFRQEDIITAWRRFKEENADKKFTLIKIKVMCSSGTYMRSLADRMGKDAGVGAIAMSIRRMKIIDGSRSTLCP